MQESNGENASVTNNLAGTTRGTAAAAAERKQEYKIKRSDCHRLWLLLPLQNKVPPPLASNTNCKGGKGRNDE
jgi:hypothetical protein